MVRHRQHLIYIRGRFFKKLRRDSSRLGVDIKQEQYSNASERCQHAPTWVIEFLGNIAGIALKYCFYGCTSTYKDDEILIYMLGHYVKKYRFDMYIAVSVFYNYT